MSSKKTKHPTRQIEIIHLSDVHFGEHHRFQPDRTPSGDIPSGQGMPTLAELLLKDLQQPDVSHPTIKNNSVEHISPSTPKIICISGDLAQTGSREEFTKAKELIKTLASDTGLNLQDGLKSIFVIPGNHDVLWDKPDMGERWSTWTWFYNSTYGTNIPDDNPYEFVKLHAIENLGVFVLCLNSEIYVQKDSKDKERGQLDPKQLAIIEETLRKVPAQKLKSSIRLAMIHHHPILIPSLAEPGRGYDAVINSRLLLNLLHKYGFHVVMHGHKHYPHTFLEDIRNGFQTSPDHSLVVVAGGSAGSKELPHGSLATNTYNRITVKWNEEAEFTRVQIVTRGLKIEDDDGAPLLPSNWSWKTLRTDDRSFSSLRSNPPLKPKAWQTATPSAVEPVVEQNRVNEYARCRGNLPVVEVRPSLLPQQLYEAKFWIVPHSRKSEDVPIEVVWSAGEKFPVIRIKREDDPFFCARFDYYGPMLISGELRFSDGGSAQVYIYARLPQDGY